MNKNNIALSVVFGLALGGCATSKEKVEQKQARETSRMQAEQKDDRADLREHQREERADLGHEHADERADMGADHAREDVKVDTRIEKKELTQSAEQQKFAIDMKEKLAKLDARIVELQRTNKPVDAATLQARDALAAHIAICDDVTLTKEQWADEKQSLKAEQAALERQVDSLEAA